MTFFFRCEATKVTIFHFGKDNIGEPIKIGYKDMCKQLGCNEIYNVDVNENGVEPVLLFHVLDIFKPVWGTDGNIDNAFMEAVDMAREFLHRFIAREIGSQAMLSLIKDVYEAAEENK